MESVDIVTASGLLGICRQRIQQLIYANRVRGAFKTKKGWQIPLYKKRMPHIIPAKRGLKGTWRLERGKEKIIHVNRGKIDGNRLHNKTEAVIIVRKGKEVTYGHTVAFKGECNLVYEPKNKDKYSGAKVWIELSETSEVVITTWDESGGETVKIVR